MKHKEPKQFRRPRLYYQAGKTESKSDSRLRIIYPDGRSEYIFVDNDTIWGQPCWASSDIFRDERLEFLEFCDSRWLGKDTSGTDALKRMRDYDKHQGYPEAEFLGEL